MVQFWESISVNFFTLVNLEFVVYLEHMCVVFLSFCLLMRIRIAQPYICCTNMCVTNWLINWVAVLCVYLDIWCVYLYIQCVYLYIWTRFWCVCISGVCIWCTTMCVTNWLINWAAPPEGNNELCDYVDGRL